MSRKARVGIPLPKGVEAQFTDSMISVKGPKGILSRSLMKGILVKTEDGQLHVTLHESMKGASNFHGLYWALIDNMVKGVSVGFEKFLEMQGVGFRAAVQGGLLTLQVGFSHPVEITIPKGIEVLIDKANIQVKGIDKQLVGQFAADIRAVYPPEPYKGKGIRYKDEAVRRKAGKAGKK